MYFQGPKRGKPSSGMHHLHFFKACWHRRATCPRCCCVHFSQWFIVQTNGKRSRRDRVVKLSLIRFSEECTNIELSQCSVTRVKLNCYLQPVSTQAEEFFTLFLDESPINSLFSASKSLAIVYYMFYSLGSFKPASDESGMSSGKSFLIIA